MILSVTSYWFENSERGRLPSARQVLAQLRLFLFLGIKPSQITPQKLLQFLIAGFW